MLETKRLNELFSLLEKMTKSEINRPKLALPLYIQCAEKYSKRGFLFTGLVFFGLALGLAAWQHYVGTASPGFHHALLDIYVLLVLFVLVHTMTLVAITWHLRKQHSSTMLTALKNDLHHDMQFIKELWKFDKATLAYGLLQYRHRWSFLEGRAAVIAGDLRKLGLFPAWAALAVSGAVLYKEDSNLYLWVPVIAAACFYLVALDALVSLERPQQVIQLLEYAIQHADQGIANPSEANTSAPSV